MTRFSCATQAKGVAKKFQQTTPKGSPTKPQPLQKAGPLEAVKVPSLQRALYTISSDATILLQRHAMQCGF